MSTGRVDSGAPGVLRVVRRSLAEMEVPPRRLLVPALYDLAAGFLRVVALGLWLPLIHGLLTGRFRFGRRFALLERLLPSDLASGATLRVFVALGGAILAVTLLKSLFAVLAQRSNARTMATAEVALSGKLLREHLGFGQAYFDRTRSGRTLGHLQRLPSKAARLLLLVQQTVGASLELVLYVAVMVWLSPQLAVAALVALPLYYFLLRRWIDRAEARAAEEEDLEEEATSDLHDLVSNLLLVRLYSPRERAAADLEQRTARRAEARTRREDVLELLDQLREGLNVALILAFVLAGAWAASGMAKAVVSRYLVFFFVFRRAMSSFSTLQKLPRRWANLRAHLEALDRLLVSGDAPVVPGGTRPFTTLAHGVTVRGLSFAYVAGAPVLDGVSFEARRGRLTTLVGENGSGKSTLFKILLRLYDCPPASVLLDGVDLREHDVESLRAGTAFAGAAPLLLNGSLRHNLTFGLAEASEARVWEAVERCGLGPVVARLPGGLESPIGDRGGGLSTGERQRLALARALARDPRLLLLDEAMSSLDAVAEGEVLGHLAELAGSRTVITISHRLATIPATAWIVVLERGRVAEQGDLETLLSRPGAFLRLWEGGGREAAPEEHHAVL